MRTPFGPQAPNRMRTWRCSPRPLAVTVFAKFFLTEPVAADGTIHAELVGFVEPGTVSNNVARDIVQLYR